MTTVAWIGVLKSDVHEERRPAVFRLAAALAPIEHAPIALMHGDEVLLEVCRFIAILGNKAKDQLVDTLSVPMESHVSLVWHVCVPDLERGEMRHVLVQDRENVSKRKRVERCESFMGLLKVPFDCIDAVTLCQYVRHAIEVAPPLHVATWGSCNRIAIWRSNK